MEPILASNRQMTKHRLGLRIGLLPTGKGNPPSRPLPKSSTATDEIPLRYSHAPVAAIDGWPHERPSINRHQETFFPTAPRGSLLHSEPTPIPAHNCYTAIGSYPVWSAASQIGHVRSLLPTQLGSYIPSLSLGSHSLSQPRQTSLGIYHDQCHQIIDGP